MRILHVDPDDVDNPLSGGGPVRTFEICRRLARRHDVTVLTPTFPGSTTEKVRDGVRYRRLGRRIGDHGSSHHITFFFALPRAVRAAGFDLLVDDLMPPMSATFNPWFTSAPVVASVQWFYARLLARQYRLPFHWAEAVALRWYRNFVVLTPNMASIIAAKVPRSKIEIIPNGVEDTLFGLEPRPGESILYVGRLDFAQKGVDLLLQAYAALPRPRRPLILAGHGYETAAVNALIARLGLDGEVLLPGRVDAAQRAQLLLQSRFVVVPSREETFGMVIAEACAAGKPVVHFDKAPMNEIAAGPGLIRIPPFSAEALSGALSQLSAASDSEIESMGRAARAAVERYRWDTLAARQEAFYIDAVDRHRLRRRRAG